MIVVDASAALLALMNDGQARSALAADALVAPHLLDSEVLQTLRRHVRSGSLTVDTAELLLRTWSLLAVEHVDVHGLLDRMWTLRDNVSAYDATYVALAEALDCPLATADRRLAAAPGPTCEFLLLDS